jgi:hypothetical protein
MNRTNIFTGLPDADVNILNQLSNHDLYNVCLVNKYAYNLCYNNLHLRNQYIDYKNLYDDTIRSLREEREQRFEGHYYFDTSYLDQNIYNQYEISNNLPERRQDEDNCDMDEDVTNKHVMTKEELDEELMDIENNIKKLYL